MTVLQSYLSNPRVKKALKLKPGQEGFSLIELVVVVAVLAVLSAIAIPNFQSMTTKARAAAASNTVATIAKECAVKYANGTASPTYAAVRLDGYTSFQVAGSTTNCATTGSIIATSSNDALYPTFSYNIATGAKTCTYSGSSGSSVGCVNSIW
jgi:type IV pilus assembly protein PilA